MRAAVLMERRVLDFESVSDASTGDSHHEATLAVSALVTEPLPSNASNRSRGAGLHDIKSRRVCGWCARQESNLDMRLRRPPFYPLNYGRVVRGAMLRMLTGARQVVFGGALSFGIKCGPGARNLFRLGLRSLGEEGSTPPHLHRRVSSTSLLRAKKSACLRCSRLTSTPSMPATRCGINSALHRADAQRVTQFYSSSCLCVPSLAEF